MPKKTLLDYLDSYKEALLNLIPDFYDDSIPSLGSKSIEWDNRKNFILKDLQEIIENLDAITKEYTIPPFRYKLYFPVYDNKDNPLLEGSIEEISENVITFFLSNLAKLRSEGVKQNTAREQILEEMHKQEREYLEKYGEKLAIPLDSEKTVVKSYGGNEPLYYDCKMTILYFSEKENEVVHIEPQEKNLLEFMNKRPHWRLDEILYEVFEKDLQFDEAIKKEDRQAFDTVKSEINRKCRETLGIEELIMKAKGYKKTFKLSKKIVFLET